MQRARVYPEYQETNLNATDFPRHAVDIPLFRPANALINLSGVNHG